VYLCLKTNKCFSLVVIIWECDPISKWRNLVQWKLCSQDQVAEPVSNCFKFLSIIIVVTIITIMVMILYDYYNYNNVNNWDL
jgi:hypothetical protein